MGGSPYRFDPTLYKDVGADGWADDGIFSGGGRIEPLLEQIMEASGASGYYLNPFDDISSAKMKIGDKGLLVGVINCIKLVTWTRQEIRAEVKRIMAEGKAGGGFLLGPLMMPSLKKTFIL